MRGGWPAAAAEGGHGGGGHTILVDAGMAVGSIPVLDSCLLGPPAGFLLNRRSSGGLKVGCPTGEPAQKEVQSGDLSSTPAFTSHTGSPFLVQDANHFSLLLGSCTTRVPLHTHGSPQQLGRPAPVAQLGSHPDWCVV